MKPVDHAHLTVVALTDEGARGKKNEDRYGVSAFQRRGRGKTPVLLAVLADGIGGHRAGEVAAELAVDQISAFVATSPEDLPPGEALQGAVQAASQAIYQHAAAAPDRQGMGATCAIAYVIGPRLFAANVGDSRIYLLRGERLRQLSIDHTWIQEALDHGVLSEDQIKGHPNAHVIRRFLGSPQPPEAAVCQSLEDQPAESDPGIRLQKGDILLLCSDGLTDLVSDDEICETLVSQPLETAGASLIDLANQRGGHDNITLILLQAPENLSRKNGRARGILLTGCLSLLVLAGLAAAILIGTNWLSPGEGGTSTPPLEEVLPPLVTQNFAQTPAATTLMPETTSTLPLSSAYPGPPIGPTRSARPTGSSGATLTPWPTDTPLGGASYP
jgi:protein phosphatase